MIIGSAHSAGKYTVPNGSGTQFTDGCNAIESFGLDGLKVYCTVNYLTDYPLQTAWSSTPTNLKTLTQTTQFATQFAKAQFTYLAMTCFTFANGATNWWMVDPSAAKMTAEFTEIYDLACHLLSTYNGSAKTFVIQNWEGDWAFMDSFTVETYTARKMVQRYAAFLEVRQRAVEAARKNTASDCKILCAVEVNRMTDVRLKPHLRRIARDLPKFIKPDMVSYSAYDSTIVEQGGWGASIGAWTSATTLAYSKSLRTIQLTWPGIPIQVGEIGFPEGIELPVGRDVGTMLQVCHDISLAAGCVAFLFWQVFDNEETSPGVPRGYYLKKPDGSDSVSAAKLATL